MAKSINAFGNELCSKLGLEPNNVKSIIIRCQAGTIDRVTVEMYVEDGHLLIREFQLIPVGENVDG